MALNKGYTPKAAVYGPWELHDAFERTVDSISLEQPQFHHDQSLIHRRHGACDNIIQLTITVIAMPDTICFVMTVHTIIVQLQSFATWRSANLNRKWAVNCPAWLSIQVATMWQCWGPVQTTGSCRRWTLTVWSTPTSPVQVCSTHVSTQIPNQHQKSFLMRVGISCQSSKAGVLSMGVIWGLGQAAHCVRGMGMLPKDGPSSWHSYIKGLPACMPLWHESFHQYFNLPWIPCTIAWSVPCWSWCCQEGSPGPLLIASSCSPVLPWSPATAHTRLRVSVCLRVLSHLQHT